MRGFPAELSYVYRISITDPLGSRIGFANWYSCYQLKSHSLIWTSDVVVPSGSIASPVNAKSPKAISEIQAAWTPAESANTDVFGLNGNETAIADDRNAIDKLAEIARDVGGAACVK